MNQILSIVRGSLLILATCSVIVLSASSFSSHTTSAQIPASGLPIPLASTSTGTTIFISPAIVGDASLTVGMNVTIAVYINNVTNLDAWEYKVKADTSILKAVAADVTPYWETQQAQGKGEYIIQVNATQGTDFVYWVSLRQPNGSIPSLTTTVPFQLGTATFQVLATTKDTSLHIVTSSQDPNYGTILLDTNLNYISYTSTDGAFANIRAPWDLNWDLKVNVIDLVRVAVSFGTTVGGIGWNPVADVNGDGRVDVMDLTLVGIHFSQTI